MASAKREIELAFPEGKRTVMAIRISDHVYAHPLPGIRRSSWNVSDPISGMRYPVVPFKNQTAAVKWAKTLVNKFSENPLQGGVLGGVKNGAPYWTTKPTHYDAIKAFLKETVYGN